MIVLFGPGTLPVVQGGRFRHLGKSLRNIFMALHREALLGFHNLVDSELISFHHFLVIVVL